MRVVIIIKRGHENTGVGRYTLELEKGLINAGLEVIRAYPSTLVPMWLLQLIKKLFNWDLEEFLNNYPIFVTYPEGDIYHFSSQNLATLLFFNAPKKTSIVTVHDLLPLILEKKPSLKIYKNLFYKLFDKISIAGLKKAEKLISVSFHTKKDLVNILNIPEEDIIVTHEGVR